MQIPIGLDSSFHYFSTRIYFSYIHSKHIDGLPTEDQ